MQKPSQVVNQKRLESDATKQYFLVFGMKRSGNHAVISWLRENLGIDGNLFLNDCGSGDPTESFFDMVFGNSKRIGQHSNKNPDRQEALKNIKNYRSVIVSFENKRVRFAKEEVDFTAFGNPDWKKILITRGFLNWLASFYKLTKEGVNKKLNRQHSIYLVAPQIWVYRDMIKLTHNNDIVAINYDDWIIDAEKRKVILRELGIEMKDNSIGTRTPYGGGSSFEGHKLDINVAAQLTRWVSLADDYQFCSLVSLAAGDDDLVEWVGKVYPADGVVLKGMRAGADMSDLANEYQIKVNPGA